jgi:HAD superfamily hydrolase (TIGR01490 family)
MSLAGFGLLAPFHLDHTLLDGDGDDLSCRFLVRQGLADPMALVRNERMMSDYRAGRVDVEDFSRFYARLLAGRTPQDWASWLARLAVEEIRPRLPVSARTLVEKHRDLGFTLVLTTASNRVIASASAAELGFEPVLATELEVVDGVYTGQVDGMPNMREGKVERLRDWLAEHGAPADVLGDAWFYSDSINDLPLLSAVGRPVAVNPDRLLLEHAEEHGWPVKALPP